MNEKKKPILGQEAVTDARTLGTPRMLILGLQHLFAMFGATVLVPILVQGYGLPLSIQTTLLMAGLGTLLFHLVTKGKVPAFLGSSFAYLGGFSIVAPMLADADGNLTVVNTKMLPYACAAVAFSGLVYLVASLLISTFGSAASASGSACTTSPRPPVLTNGAASEATTAIFIRYLLCRPPADGLLSRAAWCPGGWSHFCPECSNGWTRPRRSCCPA